MFEQESMLYAAMCSGSEHTTGIGWKSPKKIMEHKAVQNLRAASGDKGLRRQWRQKVVTAAGQANAEDELIEGEP